MSPVQIALSRAQQNLIVAMRAALVANGIMS